MLPNGSWKDGDITDAAEKCQTWRKHTITTKKSFKLNEFSPWLAHCHVLTRRVTIGSSSLGSRWLRVIRSALSVRMRCKRRRMYRAEVNSSNLGERSSALGLPLINEVWIWIKMEMAEEANVNLKHAKIQSWLINFVIFPFIKVLSKNQHS